MASRHAFHIHLHSREGGACAWMQYGSTTQPLLLSSTISSLLSRSFLFSNHVFISFCHFLSFSVFNVSRMFKCFVCTFVASYFPHCALCVHCVQCVGYTFAEPTDADGNMLSLCFENVMPSFLLMFLFLPITFCSYSPQLCLSYRFSVHFLLLTAYVIIDF